MKVSNVFNTLTLNKFLGKRKPFSKNLEYRFSVETTKTENASFSFKTALSEADVKQIEWRLQNGPVAKSEVFPVTSLFF